MTRPLIGSLLFSSGPSNIAGLVISVVVWIAIKTGAWWARANICKKVFKLEPTFANFDAASAVIFITVMVGVTTSTAHFGPNVVEGIMVSSSSVTMLIISPSAAARTGISTPKFVSRNKTMFAAIATAEPNDMPLQTSFDGWIDGDQSTEASACDIKMLAHRTAPTGLREVAGWRYERHLAAHHSTSMEGKLRCHPLS